MGIFYHKNKPDIAIFRLSGRDEIYLFSLWTVAWFSLFGKQFGVLKKNLRLKFSYDLVFPLLAIYYKFTKALI